MVYSNMIRKEKYITYKQYNKRIDSFNTMQEYGIEFIYKKNVVKIVSGCVLVGVGVVTLPLPSGSIILISVGLSLICNGGINLYKYRDLIMRKLKMGCKLR